MHFIHTSFGIDSKVAIALQAAWITDVLHHCIMDNNSGIMADKATTMLHDHISEYTIDPTEQNYLFMMWESLMMNEFYWTYAINKMKCDEHIDTMTNIINNLTEYYNSITTPLN